MHSSESSPLRDSCLSGRESGALFSRPFQQQLRPPNQLPNFRAGNTAGFTAGCKVKPHFANLGTLLAQLDDAKAAVRARFVACELPADFVARLRADRDAIADANKHNQGETLGGVENTRLIGRLLDQINTEIAELDTIMHNKYTRQPSRHGGMRVAKRQPCGTRRSTGEENADAQRRSKFSREVYFGDQSGQTEFKNLTLKKL